MIARIPEEKPPHWVREIAGWAYIFMAIVALAAAVSWFLS
jgi:hypothetical protein